MIEELKHKANQKLEEYRVNKNEKMVKRLTLAIKILSNENAFKKLDAEIMINVLSDIVGDKNKAIKIYKKII